MPGWGEDEVDDLGGEGDQVTIRMAAPPRGGAGRVQRRNRDALSFQPERWAEPAEDPAEDADRDAHFVQADDLLAQAYCVTLVRGLAPAEIWQRLGLSPAAGDRSLDDLVEEAYEVEDSGFLAGVAPVGEWTLLLEPNGSAGTRKRVLRPLSEGSETVTLFSNVNSTAEFTVFVDGHRALTFDPYDPADRRGGVADAYLDPMTRAGFFDDEADGAVCGAKLIETLTGVRLSVRLLAELSFNVTRIPPKR